LKNSVLLSFSQRIAIDSIIKSAMSAGERID